MYWDHKEEPTINGELQNDPENTNSILLIYAFDVSNKVVKLINEPILKQEKPPDHSPIESVILPNPEKNKLNNFQLHVH